MTAAEMFTQQEKRETMKIQNGSVDAYKVPLFKNYCMNHAIRRVDK